MNNKNKLVADPNNLFNGTGQFASEKAFMNISGNFPHKATKVFDDESGKFLLHKEDVIKLQEKYPDAEFCLTTVRDDRRKSSVVDDDDDDDEIYTGDSGWIGSCIRMFSKGFVLYIDCNSITVYYDDITMDTDKYIDELAALLTKKEEKPKAAEVRLIVYNQDYYTVPAKINYTEVDVEKNYNDDFLPVYKELTKFIEERDSGIVIMNGVPGTGKTTLVRNLVTRFPGRYLLVTNTVAESLASPEFMSFMSDNRDSVFILEDCEQILKDRSDSNFTNAIANILNMTDGIMSDIFNVKFICTFNADINSIDPALLRKGRCFVNYEFKPLCEEKTKALLNERGITLEEYKPMTLAEIYNYEDADCSADRETNKIGF